MHGSGPDGYQHPDRPEQGGGQCHGCIGSRIRHQLVLCDVVVAEVLAGARNNLEYDTTYQELTTQFHVLPFTMEVSQHFRDILARDARRLKVHFADLLIAATAMAHDCALLTLNKKHFKGIKGLKLA